MSRYYYLIIVSLLVLSVGCSAQKTTLVSNEVKIVDTNMTVDHSKEDALLLFALDAYERGAFKEASRYYAELYQETEKVEYATEAIKCAVFIKDYEHIKTILEKVAKNKQSDPTLNRYLVAYYIDKKAFDDAKALVNSLLEEERDEKTLELAGLVEEGLGNYDTALKYYEESYTKEKSEYAVLKITDVLFLHQNEKERAVQILETHTTMYGCSQTICTRLLQFYSNLGDNKGAANVLKRLYKTTQNEAYAEKLVQYFISHKSYNEAIEFLKETKFDDTLLLDIYTAQKEYKKALDLADKLYEENNDPLLLARSAVLEYESSENKQNQKMLDRVSKKFESIVALLNDPLYYNYYGYILIDHEIDVPKGMSLVKKALEMEPDSHFYIDSLAWGLYKEGQCEDALKLLEPISKVSEEPEIIEHTQAIKKCIEDKQK